jgi:hypothetical protein
VTRLSNQKKKAFPEEALEEILRVHKGGYTSVVHNMIVNDEYIPYLHCSHDDEGIRKIISGMLEGLESHMKPHKAPDFPEMVPKAIKKILEYSNTLSSKPTFITEKHADTLWRMVNHARYEPIKPYAKQCKDVIIKHFTPIRPNDPVNTPRVIEKLRAR